MLLSNLPDYVLLYINSFLDNSSLCKTFKSIYKYRKVFLKIKNSASFIYSNLWPAFIQSFYDISQIRFNIENPDENMLLHLFKFNISELHIYDFKQINISNETMTILANTFQKLSIHNGLLTDLSMFENGIVKELKLIYCDIKNLNGLGNIHTLMFIKCFNDNIDGCFTDVRIICNVKHLTFYQCSIPQNSINLMGNIHTLHLIACYGFVNVSALKTVHNLVLDSCNKIEDLNILKTVNTLTLRDFKFPIDICKFNKVHNLTIINMKIFLNNISDLDNITVFTVIDCKIFGKSSMSFKRINKEIIYM